MNIGTKFTVQIPIEIVRTQNTANHFTSQMSDTINNDNFDFTVRQASAKTNSLQLQMSHYVFKAFELGTSFQYVCKEIMLVDDDPFNLYSMQQLLQSQFQLKCLTAVDGIDAIQKIVERQKQGLQCPRLIIMDLNMPRMDGKQATRELRRMNLQREIDLSNTSIYMHSAIADTIVQDDNLFDGICKCSYKVKIMISAEANEVSGVGIHTQETAINKVTHLY